MAVVVPIIVCPFIKVFLLTRVLAVIIVAGLTTVGREKFTLPSRVVSRRCIRLVFRQFIVIVVVAILDLKTVGRLSLAFNILQLWQAVLAVDLPDIIKLVMAHLFVVLTVLISEWVRLL